MMIELKRLNKYISETGYCSRRDADRLIEQGHVMVNGRIPEVGTKVSDADSVKIKGKPLKEKPPLVYIAYNKPVGITCTTDSKIKENIVKAIHFPERIFPIGRLDKPSQGLIFLTNEGDIVNKILRAGNQHEKEYVVTVDKPIDKHFIDKMASGIPILDTVTKQCHVSKVSDRVFNIVLTQGLNRQIRRMCEYLGYEVTKLKRVRIMNVQLDNLKAGEWRFLSDSEMAELQMSLQSSTKTEEGSVDEKKLSSEGYLETKKESEKQQENKQARTKYKQSPKNSGSKVRVKTETKVKRENRNSSNTLSLNRRK